MDDFELEFSDVVLFELPSFEEAEAFRARFRPRRPGWTHDDEQVWLFAVDLSETPDDLAVLLREAQDLLAEHGAPAVCFLLDGRLYELEPAEPEYERTAKSGRAA